MPPIDTVSQTGYDA